MEMVRFVKMDCSCIEYLDNSFDTVVDTFGLQASYDHVQQYNEMKRVCKVLYMILLTVDWRENSPSRIRRIVLEIC